MSGTSGVDFAFLLEAEGLCRFAETERPAERPMVVLEARVAAVWRIAEGLVGGGVCFREEMFEKGSRDFVCGIGALTAGLAVFGLPGWERAAAADLAFTVEGPFDANGFFEAGLLDVGFVDAGLINCGLRSGYSSSITF